MALMILVIFLISTIGFIFMIKNTLNNFNTIRNKEIENFLKDQKEVLDFDLTSIKNVDEYYNKGILPYSDYSHSEGIVQYKINDTMCISSNVLLQYKQNEHLEDGFYTDILKGQIYIIYKKTGIENSIKITSNEYTKLFNNVKNFENEEKIDTSSINLSQNFNIYTVNKIEAFKYLNPEKIEVLNNIETKYGFANILIEKDEITVLIKSNKHMLNSENDYINDFQQIKEILNDLTRL